MQKKGNEKNDRLSLLKVIKTEARSYRIKIM